MELYGNLSESLESHVKDLVLKREIGKGSYGKVYQAIWKGREVAAKRFHSIFFETGFSSQEIIVQFKRKWEILKWLDLDHPNVMKLHTVLFPKGLSPIIITELLHRDLRSYIRESTTSPKIPEMKLICIALDVIEGLNYLHGLSVVHTVVHSNLSTQNILLTVKGNAKIADLEVAKVFRAGFEVYATPVPSTPVYAAPEIYPVVRQSVKLKYDQRVDIYSFGVVLMTMILGHEPRLSSSYITPFTKDGELISDHVRRKQDISEMGDHFLKELVLGCLENDSKQRPDLKNIKVELEGRKWMVVQRSKSCGQDKEIKIEKVGLQPLYDYKLKVLFIGDNGVGKTCLFNRFNNPFCNALLSTSTLSPDLNTESFKYGSKFVRLVLIDTPSDKLLFSTSAPFYGYVHGIFLVCDVTRHKSFENISRWLDLFRKYCSESNAIVIIIGNKVDQAKKCEVSFEEGHALAKSHGLSYMEASALEVGSIEEMFKTMIQLLTRSVDQGLKKIELDDATGKVKLKKGRPGKSKTEQFTDNDNNDNEDDDDDDDNDDDQNDADADGDEHDDNSDGVDDDDGSPVPREIKARGPRAKLAFKNALKTGKVKVFRARIMLIGQDRAGKTSLKKSFLGLPFDPKEKSTDGIDVNPSKFEFQVDQVKNWKPTDEKLDVSQFLNQLARKVAAELREVTKMNPQDDPKETSPKENEGKFWKMKVRSDTEISEFIEDEPKGIGSEMNQVFRHMVNHNDNESRKPAIPELLFDPDLPPDEFTHLLVQHLEGLNLPTDATAMEHHMTLDLWDFAGQHLYYASYPVFLSPRAVYLLIHNLSKGLKETAQPSFRNGIHDIPLSNPNHETNMEVLLSWLITVSTLCSSKDGDKIKDPKYLRPPVFIVGTHADQPHQDIEEMELQIKNEIIEKKFQDHVIRPFYSVDNTQGSSGEGVVALQKRMIEVLKEEPYMGEEIPLRWLNFEKVVDALLSKQIYHLNVEQLKIVARDKRFIADEEEFNIMLNFYHDLGIIIKHGSTVILKAQWLIDLFRQLITIPNFDDMDPVVGNHWKKVQDTGILSMELVDHVFKKFVRQGIVRDDILNMMEHFDLIAKFSPSSTDVKYFVPGQLKPLPDSLCAVEPSSSDPCPLYVHFLTGFVPHGLFSQVVSRTIRWCSEMITCTKTSSASSPRNDTRKEIKEQSKAGQTPCPKLYLNGARFIIGRRIIHDFVLLCKKRFIKVVLKQRTRSRQVSADNSTATRVREFLEETLQDLSRDLSYLHGLQYQFCVECPYCQLQNQKCTNHNQMSCPHEDCLHLLDIKQGEPLICENSFGEILTVDGLKKWSSQTTSQALSPSTSLDTAQNLHSVEHSGETLKVALLANEWGSSKGGLSTINRMLAILLAKNSTVEVTILIPQGECSEEDKRTATSHNISIREAQRRPGYNDPLEWLSFPPRDLEIDVVVGHSAKLGKQAQFITESHCCKWVQVVHTEPEELAMHKNYLGAIAKGEEKNRAEVDLCKLADLVVAVGPKLAGAFSSYLSSSHRDIFQLTPGTFANFSDVKHTKQESGKFKVLVFGRGDSEDLILKGYDIAASAVVELKDSSYRLICVGAPNEKQDEVAETLLQRGISRNQLFVRSFVQNRERLKELFCEVDVAIMPSRTEGFGLTALEAMSAGLPILVSRNSGFGEALLGLGPVGKSFVIESEDPNEWAKAIAALRQKSGTQRLQEVQTLRTSYEEMFSWEKQCESLVDKMWQMVHESGEQNFSRELQEVTVAQTFRGLQRMQHDTTGKTDLSDELKNIALNKGFIVSDNQGLGNCMFYALSEQLDLVKGIRISHEKLRQTIVQFLKDNPTLQDGTELFNFVHGYSSWGAYCRNMMADGTWGDHLILHGAANCFNTCIHVISSLSDQHDLIINPECDVVSSNRLVLGHVHELHYVSLIERKQVKDGQVKVYRREDGSPSHDELEGLSERTDSIWKKLRRRLKFDKE